MANGKKNGRKNGARQPKFSMPKLPNYKRKEKSVQTEPGTGRIITPKRLIKPKPTKNTTPVREVKPKTNTQKLREAKKTLKAVKTNRKLEKKVLQSERTAGTKLSRINNKIRKQTNRRIRTARRLK